MMRVMRTNFYIHLCASDSYSWAWFPTRYDRAKIRTVLVQRRTLVDPPPGRKEKPRYSISWHMNGRQDDSQT
jgi:hypothetical protein